MDVRVGLSGWTYAPWAGHFYPDGLPARRQLAHAASIFRAIEVNGSFYRLQTPSTFARWAEQTPDDFLFAVKGPRFITHIRRLDHIETPLANFFGSGVLALKQKLGPLLWQFPPNLPFDTRMEDFLKSLPRDTEQAAHLAKRHDTRLEGRALTQTDAKRTLRHAVEIRHESFLTEAFVDLLRAHSVALVIADSVDWPCRMDLTADFVYCRLHGPSDLYRSRYEPEALDLWARRVRAWTQGRPAPKAKRISKTPAPSQSRDVFVFFDNTDKRHAPEDAQALARRLGVRQTAGEPVSPGPAARGRAAPGG